MRLAHSATWIACALIFLSIQNHQLRGEDAVVRTIAYSGMAAPGMPHLHDFLVLSHPVQNQGGDTAFYGTVSGPNIPTLTGIWKTQGSEVVPVIHSAMTIQGFPENARFVSGNPIIMNENGDILFHAVVADPGSPSVEALWVSTDETLEVLTRVGDPAPGLATGTYFDDLSFSYSSFAMDNEGTILFTGVAANATVIPNVSTPGLWVFHRLGTMKLVACKGAFAPSFPTDCQLGIPNNVSIDGMGNLYFSCSVVSSSGTLTSAEWREQSGVLLPIVQLGQSFPGMPDGVVINSFGGFGVNRTGTVIISGRLGGPGVSTITRDAICYGEDGAVQLVLQAGQPAPGFPEGYRFRQLGPPSTVANTINDRGEIAFYGSVSLPSTPNVTEVGIWIGFPTSLRLIARSNTSVPGVPGARFTSFFLPYLNGKGKVAFRANITGGGASTANNNNQGIWGTNNQGELKLLLRTGDPIEIAKGETRIVSSFWFNWGSQGGGDSRRLVFDALGNFIVTVQFTDESWAIVQVRAQSSNVTTTP